MPSSKLRTVLNGTKLRGRRRRAQRPVLAAVAALAFLLGGLAAGLAGFVGGVSGTAVTSTLAEVPVTERVFQLSARVADDPQAQDAAAAAAFDRYVGEAPYSLHRSLLTEPRQLLDPEAPRAEGSADGLPRIALAAYDSLTDHADLVAGEWPSDAAESGPAPVALHEDAASQLGIELSDELVFEERQELAELVVVGLWQPSDRAADYWLGSAVEAGGLDNDGDGLAVVAESVLLELPGPVPVARWRLSPDVAALTAGDLGVLRVGLPSIRPYLADDPLFRDAGIGVTDDIIDGLEGADSALLATRSVAIAPLLLAVVGAAGTVALVSRLLAENRLTETLLLRGRGWSRSQAIDWALRESIRLVALPAAVGSAVGYMVLETVLGEDADVRLALVAGAAGVVIVLGVVTLTLTAARAAGPAHVTVEQRATASRRQVVGRASIVTLVVATAALATWQLRRYDGVTVADAQGIERLDPLAVAAPAALLLAAGFVVAIIMAALGRLAARVLGRGRGLTGVHAARALGRQPAAYVLPVLLIGLAAGSATFAATYTTTWHGLQREVATGQTAADIEVQLGGSRLMTSAFGSVALPDYADIDGVEDVATAMSAPAGLADGQIELVAAAEGAAGKGVELPAGASVLDLEIAAELELSSSAEDQTIMRGPDGDPVAINGDVTVWLVDAAGSGGFVASPLTLGTAASEDERVRFDVPGGGAEPWRIVAIDFRLQVPTDGPRSAGEVSTGPTWQADFSLSLAGVMADGFSVPVPGEGWAAVATQTLGDDGYDVTGDGEAGGRLSGFVPRASFGPVDLGIRVVHGPDSVAATATGAALDRFGLAAGDEASVDILGAAVPMGITDQADSIPGTSRAEAFSSDLHDLIAAVLRAGGQPPVANRIWLTTDPDVEQGAIADAAAALAGPDSTVASRAVIENELIDARLSQLVITAFWLVSVIIIGLATIGVWAGTATLLATRRVEVGVFRALGFSASQQGRQRRRELLLVGLLSTVLSGVAGFGAGWLAVPALATSATPGLPETIEPTVDVDWTLVGGSVAVLAVLVTLVVVGYGMRVRRQAAATLGVEVAG